MPLKWFPAGNGFQLPLFPHQTQTWAVEEEEEIWLLNCRSQQGFAATAVSVQEVQICQRVCGERLPKVLVCPSLAGQSLGWPGLKLGRALLSQEVHVVLYLHCSWDSMGSPPVSSQPQCQRSTKTLTWSLTLSQLKGLCDFPSQAELLQCWISQPQDLGCDRLLTHWLTLSPCPEALRKCSVPHHLWDVLLLSCSHTHPSWRSRPVLQSDSGCWQKSPEVADKSPDRVYQHSQFLNSASNFFITGPEILRKERPSWCSTIGVAWFGTLFCWRMSNIPSNKTLSNSSLT